MSRFDLTLLSFYILTNESSHLIRYVPAPDAVDDIHANGFSATPTAMHADLGGNLDRRVLRRGCCCACKLSAEITCEGLTRLLASPQTIPDRAGARPLRLILGPPPALL